MATGEIEVEDRTDEEDFADHLVALRLQGRGGLWRWAAAHALTFLIALAASVAFCCLSLVAADLLFSAGITGEYSEEDVAITREMAPASLRALLIALAVGVPAFAAAAGLLALAGRRIDPAFRLPPVAPPTRPAEPRLTRREAAARARRSGWAGVAVFALASLPPGLIWAALEWPDAVPWAADISLLSRLALTVLAVLLGMAFWALILAVALLAVLVLRIAGWVRGGMARWLLPERARLHFPPLPVVSRLPPAPRAVPGDGPSPSLLAYLFADRVVEADAPNRIGAPVPCSEAEVSAVDLAVLLLAAAFWDLRRAGEVRLEHGRRRFPSGRRRVEVTRLREAARPGLAGKAMRVPNADPDALEGEDTAGMPGPLGDVRAVVDATLGGPSEDPEWAVVSEVLEEGKQLGLLVVEDEAPRAPLRLDCEAIARQEAAFRAFEADWERFERDDRELARALRRECAAAIRRLRTLPEAGGPFSLALQFAVRASERVDRPWPRSG